MIAKGTLLKFKQEEEENDTYHPIGLSLKLMGSWNTFSRGDIDKGSRGLFEQSIEAVSLAGYTLETKNASPLQSGLGLAGEIIYNLNPRIGIGLRYSRVHPYHKSFVTYSKTGGLPYSTSSMPDLSASSFRLGLDYSLPIHRVLTICINGGPELHLVKYMYALSSSTPEFMKEISQKAKARGFGLQAGIGLEVSLNPRATLFFEAQGRYARISNFEGNESLYQWENEQSFESEEKGSLYYVTGEKYPRLAVFPEEPSGDKSFRKAVFDFTGISLIGGLRLKF